MASDEETEGHSSDERIDKYDKPDSNTLVSKKKTTSFVWNISGLKQIGMAAHFA